MDPFTPIGRNAADTYLTSEQIQQLRREQDERIERRRRQQKQVGIGEAAARGAGQVLADQGQVLAMAASAPAVAADWVANQFRDKPSTAAQDFMFRNVVDPTREATEFYEPDPFKENWDGAARMANAAGSAGAMVPAWLGTGALSALGGQAVKTLPKALSLAGASILPSWLNSLPARR